MIHTVGIREVILGILIIMALSQVINGKAILLCIIAGIYYARDYKTINQSIHGLWKGVTKENEDAVQYTMDSRKHKIEFNESFSHPGVIKILNKLKKYRKYNKPSYDKGHTSMVRFLYLLRHIQSDIPNSRDLYGNADIAYKNAIKEFQSLSVSVPTYNYKHSRAKPETHQKNHLDYSERVGLLCKELNDLCYYLLYDISLQINADWRQDPTYTKSEIIQTDIQASNEISHNHIL